MLTAIYRSKQRSIFEGFNILKPMSCETDFLNSYCGGTSFDKIVRGRQG
jgi:hypothetical protein